MDKRLNVTKNQMLRTQQPHGQEHQEQQRKTRRNNAKQQYTVIATRRGRR